MNIFPWNANFDTGIALIDEQHRQLVDLLNVLVRHLTTQADAPTLNAIFDQLKGYARQHFEDEERIWREHLDGDGWVSHHAHEHDSFVAELVRLKAEEGVKPLDEVILDIVGFLSQWLALHILESDKRLAKAVLACRAGEPPARAKALAEEAMSGHTRTIIDTVLSMYEQLTHRTLELTREISRRQKTEAELTRAKEDAERANQAKSRFLAVMSHEIRTPLGGVMGLTELALRRASDEHQADHLRKALAASRQLLGIINDVLDLSKIEADRLVLERVPFTLSGVLQSVVDVVQARATERGLALRVEIDPALSAVRWLGDPLRLGQVLINLAGNAVKFTEQGSVTLRVAETPGEDGSHPLRFEVIDTGIGIEPPVRAHLFEPYAQADASIARTHGGTGLGLDISRRLVQAMGGRIGVDSEPGRGSTFWFSLPLSRAD